MAFKLALNAGHYMGTPGKRCLKSIDPKETREWYLNDRICDKIEKLLKDYEGISVLRLDDTTGKKDVSLNTRTSRANAFKADFYLSIHHNAGIKGGKGGGIETYVYTKASKASIEWQDDLYNALIAQTKLKGNRADGTRSANFHEVKYSNMPAVLIEAGFMDSTVDTPIILTDKYADQVATACVEVIVKRAKLKKKVVQPVKPVTPVTPTNTFKPKKEYVKAFQKAAIADGYNQKKGYFKKYGADGAWGAECEAAAKKITCKIAAVKGIYKQKNLVKFIQSRLGYKGADLDGKFWKGTQADLMAFQRKRGLKPTGVADYATWKELVE